MKTELQRWIEAQIHASRSLTALAVKWGYPGSYLVRWRDGQVPELTRAAELAEKAGVEQAFMWRLIAEAIEARQRERAARRLPPTAGGAAALPRPTPAPEPLAAVAQGPITGHPRTKSGRGKAAKSASHQTYYDASGQIMWPWLRAA